MLTPVLADRHPWPDVISSTRFGQQPPRPVEYTRVAPTLVVELDADVAFEQDRWRHAVTLVRVRPDLRPSRPRRPSHALAAEAVELARRCTCLSAARREHDRSNWSGRRRH